jgi:hypothetical protein
MMSLKIKGGAELDKLLGQAADKLAAGAIRGGMRQLGLVVAEEAKTRVSSSGSTRMGKNGKRRLHADDVRASIKVRTSLREGGIVTGTVYTRSFLAPWLEYGTAAHLVAVRAEVRPVRQLRDGRKKLWSVRQINRAAARGSLVIGNRFVGSVVSHPGASPHPFMRPAVDAKVEAGVEAMAQYIQARLEKFGLAPPPETEPAEDPDE